MKTSNLRTDLLRPLTIAIALGVAASARAAPPAGGVDPSSLGSAAPSPTVVEPTTGMVLLYVKGGCFPMGNVFGEAYWASREFDNEFPVHEVCLSGFYVGKYEVTQGQWKAVMGNNPTAERGSGANCVGDTCAVDNVTREEVQQFLDRLNRAAGPGTYRLPTEAEWEYAARSGGKAERFSGGNDVESVSWQGFTSGYSLDPPIEPPWAHPVGQKAPNGLGIHDMSGNVYEYVSDWYDPGYYAVSPRDNPKGPASGTERMKRGGCAHGPPRNGRTTRRHVAEQADEMLGLRVVRAP